MTKPNTPVAKSVVKDMETNKAINAQVTEELMIDQSSDHTINVFMVTGSDYGY